MKSSSESARERPSVPAEAHAQRAAERRSRRRPLRRSAQKPARRQKKGKSPQKARFPQAVTEESALTSGEKKRRRIEAPRVRTLRIRRTRDEGGERRSKDERAGASSNREAGAGEKSARNSKGRGGTFSAPLA